MVYKIFRKHLLFQDDFLIDCGRPKSRQDHSELPRSCLGSQIHDTSGVCGRSGDSSCGGGGDEDTGRAAGGGGAPVRPGGVEAPPHPHPRAVLCP